MRVGIDTGGTFTDVVTDDGRVAKVPSTPADPARAVADALAALGAPGAAVTRRPDVLAHGTTVATNALLEHTGAPVALVTNRGFADLIEIGRQTRPALYDPWRDRPPPPVPRAWRLEVGGRLDARGREVEPVDPATVPALPDGVDAAAVCLLHADLNPAHERIVAEVLRARGVTVTCSHEVSPEAREYERFVTTVLDARLRPHCRAYLEALVPLAGTVLVMTSAGGLVPVAAAAGRPADLLLSGPAGGVRAAAQIAVACGFPDAVSFDMGGTSTDVCLVRGGVPEPAPTRTIGGYPIRRPALDVHTIGAGGGSLARIDAGGALVVGPGSAGADPGPACYGPGGTRPTVTDADLVAGRLPPGSALPGIGPLDADAAARALADAGIDATGVLAVVDAAMEEAVRVVTVARGVDPRSVALVAFGGAGPMHGCAIAEALGMPAVIVPPRAGVGSAVGLLEAPEQQELVRSWAGDPDPAALGTALDALAAEARARVGPDAVVTTALDCRYAGQGHELTVATVAGFHAAHEARNGSARTDAPVEVVALRARAERPAPVALGDLPVPARAPVTGPAVVAEPDCTIVVPAGWAGEPGPLGALILRRRP